MPGAAPSPKRRHFITASLLALSDAIAAILLAADLLVVAGSVLLRFVFNAPVEWADDVARGLMVGSSFFGAASALARSENLGVAFFVDLLPARVRPVIDAVSALLVAVISAYVAFNAIKLGALTAGQTTGSGLPLELTFYPMGVGSIFMTIFALDQFHVRPLRDAIGGIVVACVIAGLYLGWDFASPDTVPSSGTLMLVGFFITLFGGLPIGFALALAALIFIWVEGTLPGVIFAQQMARGIDNFVLLAIPFFILVGYLMEANGMSVRLIELLQRAVGRMRGGLNVVMVTSMVLFSGISGSKMADVAAVGSVLIPAARRSRQNPGSAVALLAASAVMAETIPPCINLIILGFVANLSIGGLFVAGLLPAGLMALALIVVCIIFGRRPQPSDDIEPRTPISGLWSGAIASFGLIFMIFFGFKSGFATATEISAFAALYAIVIGSDTHDTIFSAVEIDGHRPPHLGDRYVQPESAQAETRSHGFFFSRDFFAADDSDGVLGLPVARPARPAYAQLFENSVSMVYVRHAHRHFAGLGTLDATDEGIVDDSCVASCVDWYGNARPIFLSDRTFALMGYELVEGKLARDAIHEVARVSFAPKAVHQRAVVN